jgi:hypothetical protein
MVSFNQCGDDSQQCLELQSQKKGDPTMPDHPLTGFRMCRGRNSRAIEKRLLIAIASFPYKISPLEAFYAFTWYKL